MSDHIDGPRQIGDPSADLTDLFAFTSPENPARTVLAANVFPTCGVDAVFSNAIDHSIVIRRAKVAGLGDATKFETSEPELRFSFRFDALERGADQKPVQRGACILPDGQTLRFVVNEENGSSTSDGTFRVFAGLRSDPFILAWLFRGNTMTPVQNLLEHDNVLCIVVEFDTRRVLIPERGSLFGVIAETTPLPRPGALLEILLRVSIGSAGLSRLICVSTIPDWRGQTIFATFGTNRRRLRLGTSFAPFFSNV